MVQGKLKEVLKCFNDVVDPIIKKYSMPKKLSIAMAEGDDDCDDVFTRLPPGAPLVHVPARMIE